ncbi:MAG: hypothetical protein ACJAS1_007378 [Oleiphilaceae bacterium]|jgi:hypothetical protein
MSQFKKNNAIGKAGEHYFAYWVMSRIGWPCRLLDLDIGIDAQVEILNRKEHSTGEFIAVQIKTTATKIPIKTVYKKHLEYWKELDDELIYISISNASEDAPIIYWKHLNKDTIARLQEIIFKNGTSSVELDLNNSDILSAEDIKNLTGLKYSSVIDDYIAKENDLCEAYAELCQFFTIEEYLAENKYFERWIMKSEPDEIAILGILSVADRTLRYFDFINDIENRYPKINHVANVNIDWDIENHVDEMLIILIKHTKDMQNEILSTWAKSNPNSKVLSYF